MDVYFGGNFWGHPKEAPRMQEYPIDQTFEWDGLAVYLPAIYVCKEGIALDICIRVPGKSVGLDVSFSVCVNGHKMDHTFGCSESYIPFATEERDGTVREELMQAYDLDRSSGWCIMRQMCSWEGMPKKIDRIDVRLTEADREYMGSTFTVGMDSGGSIRVLTNPFDGTNYKLHIKEVWQEKIDAQMFQIAMGDQIVCPGHCMQFSYNLAPKLPDKSFQLRARDNGDVPRMGGKRAAAVQVVSGHAAVTATIDTADGPTAVFVAGKFGTKEERMAISPLSFSPVETAVFSPVFFHKEREDLRISIEKTLQL